MPKKHPDAAVFLLLGQSNAVGHDTPMQPADMIGTPLKNVFGLSRRDNQSFDRDSLTWSGYTSHSMNLAEQQDNTYSVANCLARLWQDAVDAGEKLPDLYIVQIAIGAQGVGPGFMWNPGYEKKLIPGALGTVDIALYPYTLHIFSLLDDSFAAMGKSYEMIGLHWRGTEEDTERDIAELRSGLESLHRQMFRDFRAALGVPTPIVLHKLLCHERMTDMDATGRMLTNLAYVNEVFDTLAAALPDVTVFDASRCPDFIPDVRGNGIFIEDVVHYTPSANRWVAAEILREYRARLQSADAEG